MTCPRCHGATDSSARSCARCGAPLLLEEDPAPFPLDRALDLDRRGSSRPGRLELGAADDVGPGPGAVPRRDRDRDETGAPPGPSGAPAGAVAGWRRAAAWAVDAGVLAAASAPPLLLAWRALPAGPDLLPGLLRTAAPLAALLGFSYAALAHALMGATVGKRLLGLQVIGPDGGLPSLGRSAARSGLAILGAGGLGLGVLPALFTKSHRGLHDLLADTVVIRTP